jgi:hypothetical protein
MKNTRQKQNKPARKETQQYEHKAKQNKTQNKTKVQSHYPLTAVSAIAGPFVSAATTAA